MLGGSRRYKEKPALQILQKQAEDPDQETAEEAHCSDQSRGGSEVGGSLSEMRALLAAGCSAAVSRKVGED